MSKFSSVSRCRSQIGAILMVTMIWFCIQAGAFAQGRGSISGTVVDPTGAAIPSATIALTQTGTGTTQTVQSQATGLFVFPALTPTGYSMSSQPLPCRLIRAWR